MQSFLDQSDLAVRGFLTEAVYWHARRLRFRGTHGNADLKTLLVALGLTETLSSEEVEGLIERLGLGDA